MPSDPFPPQLLALSPNINVGTRGHGRLLWDRATGDTRRYFRTAAVRTDHASRDRVSRLRSLKVRSPTSRDPDRNPVPRSKQENNNGGTPDLRTLRRDGATVPSMTLSTCCTACWTTTTTHESRPRPRSGTRSSPRRSSANVVFVCITPLLLCIGLEPCENLLCCIQPPKIVPNCTLSS